jgi:hypothetical protein
MERIAGTLMRRMAALAGYSWTDEELEAMAPLVTRTLAAVSKLELVRLADVEPSIRFDME